MKTYILTFERRAWNNETRAWDIWVSERIVCKGSEIERRIRDFDIKEMSFNIVEADNNDDFSSSLASYDDSDYQSNLVPDNSHYEDIDGEWQPYRSNNR